MRSRLLFLFILIAANSLAQNHPWQMFHGNAQHAGSTTVTGPQSNALKWTYNLGTQGMEGPNSICISHTGTIYVCGPDKITALDRNGNFKWTKPYNGAQGPAISGDGKNIFFVANKKIVSLDTLGNQNWVYNAPDTLIFGGTISANDSVLYAGCWDKYVYAINTYNGTLKWKYLTYGSVSYPPTIAIDGSIIVGGGDAHRDSDSTIYSIYPNGTLKWKFITNAMNGAHCGSPAIGPDGLIYEAAQPTLYVLNNNGVLQWSAGNFQNGISGIITPAVSADTTIYIGASNGILTALNGTTHAIKWQHQTGPDPNMTSMYGVIGFPVVDDQGTVFVGAMDHKVYAIDKNGNVKWTYTTGARISEASPALDVDGTLYITSSDGFLYAFGTLTSVEDENVNEQMHVSIFPNPMNENCTLKFDNPKSISYELMIYDDLGNIVRKVTGINSGEVEIQRGELEGGIYFFRVFIDGKVLNGKFVVE